jgi:hypothetical protein
MSLGDRVALEESTFIGILKKLGGVLMGSLSFRASRISGRHEPYLVMAIMSCFLYLFTQQQIDIKPRSSRKVSWQSCVTTSVAMTSCLKDNAECRCARTGHKPKVGILCAV